MAPKQRVAQAVITPAAMDAQLQQIIARGTPIRRFPRKSGQWVPAEDGRRITLIGADNRPTAEGTRYFELLGVPPPSLYNYDQPLHNDKLVIGNDGRTILVRRREGTEWEITPRGEASFKYNRSEYMPRIPYLVATMKGTTEEVVWEIARPRRPNQFMSLPESPTLIEEIWGA